MTMRFKLAILVLMLLFLAAYGFSQSAKAPKTETPDTTTQNLVRGVSGPVGTNTSWSGYTVFGGIPGSALFPIASTTTVLSYGFTAGSEADVTAAVLYTTARGSTTITAVTPVTYQGNLSFSIDLASTSVCPTAPSASTPCIVKSIRSRLHCRRPPITTSPSISPGATATTARLAEPRLRLLKAASGAGTTPGTTPI